MAEKKLTDLSKIITVNPKQCGGLPCIRGMRIRVMDVLDLLANGLSPQQILKELPDITDEDIRTCIRYAALQVNHPVMVGS